MVDMEKIRSLRQRWRTPLILFGVVIFALGGLWSVRALNLRFSDIAFLPALLIFAVLAPANTALAAVTLQITGRAIGCVVTFRTAMGVASSATLAELLPLPGGAMVRGAALVQHGATAKDAAWIITLTAILTLGMTVGLAGLALVAYGRTTVGGGVCLVSLVSLLVLGGIIARRLGRRVLVSMLSIRFATLGLSILRLSAAFATIHQSVTLIEPALLTVSSTLGAAVSIVPAGFGINEVVAGALATLVSVPPSSAFLAVALNRIIDMCANAVIALGILRNA